MGTGIKIVILIFGVLLTVLWLILMFSSNGKYDEQIEEIDPDEYFLPELFQIGYAVIDKLHLDLSIDLFKKKKEKLIEIKGQDEAEFFLYVNIAGQISYILTLLPIGLMLTLLADSIEILFLIIIATIVLVYYFDYMMVDAVDDRHDELLRNLPNVLSKLALLTNTGMILNDAWAKIAYTGEGVLYQEMRAAYQDMENGIATRAALESFSRRCNVKEIKKFVSVVEQNQEKGSGELANSLKELADESWNEKKQLTIQKGAAADSKLLIPTGIIFIGILLVIIIPLFTNMF